MDAGLYAAFVMAAIIMGLIPGPNVALVTANSIAYGIRAGLLTVCIGVAANALQLTLVTIGLAAVIASAGAWFSLLRWAGVLYLLWLGIQNWRAGVGADDLASRPIPVRSILLRTAAVSLTNPKTLLFYAALFPQFVSPSHPAMPQIIVLGITMVATLLLLDSCWALTASRARGLLLRHGRLRHRLTGGLLIGAGLGLAAVHAE